MEIENEAKFDISEDGLEFSTQSNGDRIRIRSVNMSAECAGALAYMVNGGEILEIQIKVKGT